MEDGRNSRRRKFRKVVRERPGLVPSALFHIIGNTVFLRLSDVASGLPDYDEQILLSSMDSEEDATGYSQRSAYNTVYEELREALAEALKAGSKRLLATYLQTLLAYPEGCTKGETVFDPRSGEIIVQVPPLSEERLYPKEKTLVDLVAAERMEGRRVLVYATHTGTRDITERMDDILTRHGFRVAVMKADAVALERREAWVAWLRTQSSNCSHSGLDSDLLSVLSFLMGGVSPLLGLEPVLFRERVHRLTVYTLLRVPLSYSYMSQVARGHSNMGVKVQARVESALQAPAKVAPAQPACIDREAVWERMNVHGISQNEAARRAGLSSAYLSQIMSGKSNPSPGVLKKLHGVLFQRSKAEERVMPAEVKVLGWKKGKRRGIVVRGAGGPGHKDGGGTVRVGGRVPWGAKAEFAYRAGYDGRGRVSVNPVVERGYSAMLTQPELAAA